MRIDPVVDDVTGELARQTRLMATANLRGVPGTFSREHVKVQLAQAGGVELEGVLAIVAEYGTGGRGWHYWGKRVSRSPVPPARATSGRPKPEDGYVLGKAWRDMRKKATEGAADAVWNAYSIQFDRAGIYEVAG